MRRPPPATRAAISVETRARRRLERVVRAGGSGGGATGPAGPAGPAGADGADGATGPAGADGATLAVAEYTLAARPAASSTWKGKFISVKDPGADGELHYCRQTAGGGYEWIIVAF